MDHNYCLKTRYYCLLKIDKFFYLENGNLECLYIVRFLDVCGVGSTSFIQKLEIRIRKVCELIVRICESVFANKAYIKKLISGPDQLCVVHPYYPRTLILVPDVS